jgi:long-chain acyl-CoA synthetase
MTFAAELAVQRPDEIAVRDDSTTLNWAEVDERLRRAVRVVQAWDLGPSRRVGVFAENSVDTLLAYAAITLAGAAAVPISFHLTAGELAYILEDSGATAVLADGRTAPVAAEAARATGIDLVAGWAGASGTPGVADWESLLGSAPAGDPPTDRRPLPTLLYTSGTTGRPKGVELPPQSFAGGDDIDEHLARLRGNRMIPYGRHLVVGPMYHSGPLTGTRLLLGGAPVTVLGRFDAEGVLAAIDRDRIGSAIMVPTHFQRLLALPQEVRDRYDLTSLQYVFQVGAKCPPEVKRAMIEWWGPILWESYGGSEVGSVCRISAAEWLEHPGSVGRPIPPFEVVVLDEDGEPQLPGTEGRLYFRDATGRGVVYHGAAAPAASAAEPGLFTLGEIGYVDDDGYVFITDRFSDMVVSGGVNIYPAEAEQLLAQHPGVADVACIGVPHQDMGEQLKALVVAADPSRPPSEAELIGFCRERLAHVKCPRSVDVVDSLGRTPLGKLNKQELRRPFWRTAAARSDG